MNGNQAFPNCAERITGKEKWLKQMSSGHRYKYGAQSAKVFIHEISLCT